MNFPLKGFEYMKIKAYAKINISLDVVGKRKEDGYHLLKMIMQNIDIYDVTTSHDDSVYMEVYKPAPVFGSLRAGLGICQTRLLALMILSVSNSLR